MNQKKPNVEIKVLFNKHNLFFTKNNFKPVFNQTPPPPLKPIIYWINNRKIIQTGNAVACKFVYHIVN